MNDQSEMSGEPNIDALRWAAIARDLDLLAVLNDREPTQELLEQLRAVKVHDWFGFVATSEVASCARALMDEALSALPPDISSATLDELAADFANIYLIHSYRAPPTESPWIDKDQLERQEPMFEVASWYRRHGLATEDRQRRSDDHLVLQLQFLSHLFGKAALNVPQRATEAAEFMDAHLLRWIGQFAERVAARCMTPYFCSVVTLTHGYLEDVRSLLAQRFDLPRKQPAAPKTDAIAAAPDAGAERYLPGVAPSW